MQPRGPLRGSDFRAKLRAIITAPVDDLPPLTPEQPAAAGTRLESGLTIEARP